MPDFQVRLVIKCAEVDALRGYEGGILSQENIQRFPVDRGVFGMLWWVTSG